jgi:hypothetical protein
VLRKKPKAKADGEKLEILTHIVFKNLNRTEILFTDFPWQPEEFYVFESHNRRFKLFADCAKAEHYKYDKCLNCSIYFLKTLRRKQIDLDFPLENQIKSFTKYFIVTGPPCSGKTSASKFASN